MKSVFVPEFPLRMSWQISEYLSIVYEPYPELLECEVRLSAELLRLLAIGVGKLRVFEEPGGENFDRLLREVLGP